MVFTVTGISIHVAAPVIGAVCVLYTTAVSQNKNTRKTNIT